MRATRRRGDEETEVGVAPYRQCSHAVGNRVEAPGRVVCQHPTCCVGRYNWHTCQTEETDQPTEFLECCFPRPCIIAMSVHVAFFHPPIQPHPLHSRLRSSTDALVCLLHRAPVLSSPPRLPGCLPLPRCCAFLCAGTELESMYDTTKVLASLVLFRTKYRPGTGSFKSDFSAASRLISPWYQFWIGAGGECVDGRGR